MHNGYGLVTVTDKLMKIQIKGVKNYNPSPDPYCRPKNDFTGIPETDYDF